MWQNIPRVSALTEEWLSNDVRRVRVIIWYVSRFTQSSRTSEEEDNSQMLFRICSVYKIVA